MLTGKFWITPTGTIDLTGSEHVLIARRKILCLQEWDDPSLYCSPFHALTDDDMELLTKRKGVDLAGMRYLATGGDARYWAIEKYGWVRVAKDKMNAWALDSHTLKLIREANDYWDKQKLETYDCIEMSEFLTDREYEIPHLAMRALEGFDLNKYKTRKESQHVSL